ncbi:MAG: hypothetical protein C0596_11885 [Marinilabiliales bacterium]|nr:MAG: hypothetical protein C0596_11885 [Marinilabiliales bacterium]
MRFHYFKIILLIVFGFLLSINYLAFERDVDSLLVELQNKNIDAYKEANLYFELGKAYLEVGEYPEALENASIALNLFSKIKQNSERAESLKLIGDIYSSVNDFDKSLESYLNAMAIAESLRNDKMIALINSEIGRLFIKISEFEKALDRFKLSIEFYESSPDNYSDQLITNYANIGVSYGSLSRLDSALMYFEKAYVLYPEDDLLNRAGVLNNIGAIKFKQEKYTEAMELYVSALELFEEAKADNGIGIALFNIAQTYLIKSDNQKAEEYFEKSVPYLENSGELYYLYRCYEMLSDFNEQAGNLNESLKFHKLYSITKDSIMNVETLNKISSLQMQYEIKKVEHKIQILEKDAKLKQIKQYIIIGSFVLLFIIGGLLYLNLRNKFRNNKLNQKILSQERERLEKELKYKNKELENFALHIVQKNEFLNTVRNDLKDVGQDYNKLKEILFKVNQNLYLEKDREEFNSHLEKIHESFFLKLNQRFPDLTQNDKRLCALLAIDLATKDIAAIVNISQESVKKSRYRLRKKLNLETEENLSEFLKNL